MQLVHAPLFLKLILVYHCYHYIQSQQKFSPFAFLFYFTSNLMDFKVSTKNY